MGLGAVLAGPDGSRHLLSEAATERGCNNEAELRAVMAALHRLQQQGVTAACVYSDNSIVVEQLGGRGDDPPPVARLAALFDEARALMGSFERASVHWLPRHRNAEADALARAALGLAPKPAHKPTSRRRRR
jgi:ribonuclease HI